MRQYRYIAIVGSRSASYEDVENAIKSCRLSPKNHVIVSGGAGGADAHAKAYAERNGFHYVEAPAFWGRGKQAGLERNSIIVDVADAVIAVWDGTSRGTKDTIYKARELSVKLQVFMAMGERVHD